MEAATGAGSVATKLKTQLAREPFGGTAAPRITEAGLALPGFRMGMNLPWLGKPLQFEPALVQGPEPRVAAVGRASPVSQLNPVCK